MAHHKQAVRQHLLATTGKDIPLEFIRKQGVQHKNPDDKATIISKEPIWEILIESKNCEIVEQGNGDLAPSLNSTSPIVYYATAHKSWSYTRPSYTSTSSNSNQAVTLLWSALTTKC
jgi:hypothetical protein